MADYYSLLAKLLDGLPEASADTRQGVYDRARRALSEQLRSVTPPLTDEEIGRESLALEDAIGRLEAGHEAPESAGTPARDRTPPAAAEIERPVAAPRDGGRPEVVAIRRGGRRQRPGLLLAALACLALPVGVLAWLWRDQPRAVPDGAVQQPSAAAVPAPPVDNKYGERIGGTPPDERRNRASQPAPSQPPPAAAAAPPASPPASQDRVRPSVATPAPPAQSPDLAVAQRALIFEENPADPQQPSITGGRALWRLDGVNAGQGLPLETVIRGSIELPAAGLTLQILVRRNLDAALPASHTIELTFANVAVEGRPARTVRDVALPMMRPEEAIRGIPVAGLPVPVKENVFLIGLSDLKGDVDRNTELLLRRNWMELPIRFASGQKAALLFDKGVSGERVFLDAFRQWGAATP